VCFNTCQHNPKSAEVLTINSDRTFRKWTVSVPIQYIPQYSIPIKEAFMYSHFTTATVVSKVIHSKIDKGFNVIYIVLHTLYQ